MTLKKTCACGKCNQESDSIGYFSKDNLGQTVNNVKRITKMEYERGKKEERERINKKIDKVYEKETLKYNYVEIYNFIQKLKQEIENE